MAQGVLAGVVLALAGNTRGYARDSHDPMSNRPGPLGGAMRGAASGRPVAPASAPVQVGQADFAAFERSLQAVNAAWSRGDTETLARLSTPEMLRYFSNDLQDLKARGWHNETRDVRLESGDLAEAWGEDGQEFATVAMRFSLIDVTRDSSGKVVEGDPQARQTVTEIWTFTRRPGQDWLLSAIQQAA
jgi:predicted lipid-binding transport protein (Tim44 family)